MSNGSRSFNFSRPEGRAKVYNKKRFGSPRMKKVNAIEMAFAQKLVEKVGTQGSIADVPCGSGRFLEIFSQAKTVYAIDYCENMLKEARSNNGSCENIQFSQGDVKNIFLQDNSVDGVFCMRLFHHVGEKEDRAKIFAELARVSKHWVALSFYRTECWKYWRKKIFGKKITGYPISRSVFLKEAKSYGLQLETIINIRGQRQTLALFKVI